MIKTIPYGKYEVFGDQSHKKEASLLKLCVDKVQALLSWEAVLNFQETVEFTALWYKNYYENGVEKGKESTELQIRLYEDLAKERGYEWSKSQ